MGFLGIGGMNAPFYVYISRWFDRRRGSALALISSGSYVAGAIWPSIFERAIAYAGWRQTMLYYGLLELVVVVPLAADLPARAAGGVAAGGPLATASAPGTVMGWPPNLVFALVAVAVIFCCIPMAMPQAHLPALCSDLGILASHGAAMLSVLLGTAFISRQFWGWVSDRIGGLNTVLTGSAVPDPRHDRLHAHPGRSRPVHRRRRFSDWALPASSRPTSWRSASCSRRRKPIGGSRRSSCAVAPAWRSADRSPACSTTTSAPMRRLSPPASAANAVNLAIVGALVFRQRYSRARAMLP